MFLLDTLLEQVLTMRTIFGATSGI